MSNEPGITLIKDVLAHESSQELLRDIAEPQDNVFSWLEKLTLLGDIPFQHIVPDSRLLPQNSLRFFYVDPSWLNALIDGALSISTNTTLEEKFTSIMAESLRDKSGLKARTLRSRILGTAKALNDDGNPVPDYVISGLMLRSELVSAYPGLKIVATYPGGKPSGAPMRYETIGNDLILIVFAGVPDKITIQQPPHGLQFGVEDGETAASFTVYLRNIGATDTGAQIKKDRQPVTVTIPVSGTGALFRPGGNRVLDIRALKNTLQTGLKNAGAFPSDASLISPSQFVMQILKTPEEAIYTNSLNTTINEQ